MLIRDPYLQSHHKYPDPHSHPKPPAHPNTSILSQPLPEPARHRAASEAIDLQARVRAYERQMRALQHANLRQQQAARKMLSFQQANRQYHEAMRVRNYELNSKLKDAVTEVQVVHHRTEEDIVRYAHQKDALLRRYEERGEEIVRMRATLNTTIEQKTRIEEELSAVSFVLEKERHQGQLEMRELAFRMQSMDRTYRNLVTAKDEEIAQLINRLRLYEEQNRKLNDINKTLQLTKDRNDKIDNLSQIHHPESNIKSTWKDKENDDGNVPRSTVKDDKELKEQKTINEELRRELENIKKHLGEMNQRNTQMESSRQGDTLLQTSRWQGIITSIFTLREAINKQVFELFYKSVRQCERIKQNSLLMFIQNWKCLQMQRLQPYVKSYFQARNNLKEIAATPQARESVYFEAMEEVIPLRVGARPGRSNINQWILSTIQFTKNQKEASKKGLNNYLLFLFRLLTIQYRVKYPMKGKSYSLDKDVTNQLMHEVVKAVQLVSLYHNY